MNNRIRNAMNIIKATDELKNSTYDFMKDEMVKRQKKTFSLRKYAVAVCLLLMISIIGFGGNYYLFLSPASYISMDFNPSVELTLNRFDKVIDVKAYNDKSKEIAQNLNFKDNHFTAAIEQLLSDEKLENYIKEDSLLSFTVISQNEDAILSKIKQCNGYKKYNAECYSENKTEMKKAHDNGMSFGKYRAYQELLKYSPDFPVDDFQKLTMREIRDIIDEYVGKASSNGQKEQGGNKNGSGNRGNGNGYRGGKN